jgi:translation initiation factor 2-alpha kinase 4
MHRGITPRCIGLSSRDQGQGKQIKLGRVGYYTLLLDLHRSNAFGSAKGMNVDDSMTIPEAW